MAKLVGNIPICIIQGASYRVRRKFNKAETEAISKVYLSCNALNIVYELVLDDDTKEFVYLIDAETTGAFTPIQTTYDLTVEYLDGTVAIETGVCFIVKERKNPFTIGEGE